MKWNRVNNSVKSFRLENEPEMIHVIKTGFRDRYIVVHEDAYELILGDTQILHRDEIELKYDIKL